jgi:hypothetical protein
VQEAPRRLYQGIAGLAEEVGKGYCLVT